jgi:hypothetical protein
MLIVIATRQSTHLHDELDRPNEETQELEDQILLLFLHLIETELLLALDDFLRGQAGAGGGLEKLFGNGTGTTGLSSLFLLLDISVLRLELLDQGIHVLVFLFVILRRRLGSCGVVFGANFLLLIEVLPLAIVLTKAIVLGWLGRHGGLKCLGMLLLWEKSWVSGD